MSISPNLGALALLITERPAAIAAAGEPPEMVD
jgi:hypothetical protein